MANGQPPIVVGVDGSQVSSQAACWAGSLAAKLGAQLQILHAMPYLGHNATDVSAAMRAVAIDRKRSGADRILSSTESVVREAYPALTVTTELSTAAADDALVAASRTARFVVVGCEDVSSAGAVLLGSASLAVIEHASCPVVVWRGGCTNITDQPIVAGVDGSATTSPALATAFDLADQLRAPLRAIHGWSTRQPPEDVSLAHFIDEAVSPVDDSELSEAAQWRHVNTAVDSLRRCHPHVNVTLLGLPGRPAAALLDHVGDAQLVVTGYTHRNVLARMIFGSTSRSLLHHAGVPVVVCPDL